jgi:hypothetical protein
MRYEEVCRLAPITYHLLAMSYEDVGKARMRVWVWEVCGHARSCKHSIASQVYAYARSSAVSTPSLIHVSTLSLSLSRRYGDNARDPR